MTGQSKATKPAGCAAMLLIFLIVIPSATCVLGGLTGDFSLGAALFGWVGLIGVVLLKAVQRSAWKKEPIIVTLPDQIASRCREASTVRLCAYCGGTGVARILEDVTDS